MNRYHFTIFIAAALGLPSQGKAEAAPPATDTYTYAVGKALEFHPFALADFTNPVTGQPYLANEPVVVSVGGHVTTYSSALDFIQTVNDAEKEFTRIGKSLRSGNIKLDAHTLTNPNLILGQMGNSLGLSINKLRTKILPALANCDLINVTDLNIDGQITSSTTGERRVSLASSKQILVQDFVNKVNEQQRFLCQLGYSFVNRAALGTEGAVSDIMARRSSIMAELGITPAHPIFNFSVLTHLKNVRETANEIIEGADALQNPTPTRLYDLARKVSVNLPPELRLPDIPSIPSPTVPKRPGLKLEKSKTWDKLHLGNMETAEAHVNAYFEINGSETKQELRTQGKAGIYVLKKEFSIIEAHAYAYAQSDGVSGHLEASVLGKVLYNPKIDKQVSYQWGDDKAFYYPLPALDYTQPFVIGVVPAFVSFGMKGEVGLGWSAGLTLVSATASTSPYADLKVYGIGAAGIKDLIELGATGEIMVINDRAVVQADTGIKFDDTGIPRLEMSLTGDNHYDMLDGRIYAYVKADALTAVSKAFPAAVKLVNDAGAAVDRAAEALNGAAEHVGNAVAKVCGWSAPIYVNGLGEGVGYFNFDDIAHSLTYYQEFEIYAAHGVHGNPNRFMNYHIKITPFGSTLDGDSVNNTDREEAAQLDQVLSLQEQEIAVEKLANTVAHKQADLFAVVDKEINSPVALDIEREPEILKMNAFALDGDLDTYLEQLKTQIDASIHG